MHIIQLSSHDSCFSLLHTWTKGQKKKSLLNRLMFVLLSHLSWFEPGWWFLWQVTLHLFLLFLDYTLSSEAKIPPTHVPATIIIFIQSYWFNFLTYEVISYQAKSEDGLLGSVKPLMCICLFHENNFTLEAAFSKLTVPNSSMTSLYWSSFLLVGVRWV